MTEALRAERELARSLSFERREECENMLTTKGKSKFFDGSVKVLLYSQLIVKSQGMSQRNGRQLRVETVSTHKNGPLTEYRVKRFSTLHFPLHGLHLFDVLCLRRLVSAGSVFLSY